MKYFMDCYNPKNDNDTTFLVEAKDELDAIETLFQQHPDYSVYNVVEAVQNVIYVDFHAKRRIDAA